MTNSALAKLSAQQTAEERVQEFATAVVAGLSKPKKSLPSRFFYDARGSELFEQITQLPEYYPTRIEVAILKAHVAEIASGLGQDTVLVEFGSGSSLKTEILIDHMPNLAAYIPIDISQSALADARQRLAARYPRLDIRPLVGDFSKPIDVPSDLTGYRRVGFFPGSTLGNLVPADAAKLLGAMRLTLGSDSQLIIGIDLKKEVRKLIRAYNDSAGVTSDFNLNLLARINRELDGGIDLDSFRHEAIYNPGEGRVEMHLVSEKDQEIPISGRRFTFRSGETIHTENSYKYSIDQFQALAGESKWQPLGVWTDDDKQFSVHLLGCA